MSNALRLHTGEIIIIRQQKSQMCEREPDLVDVGDKVVVSEHHSLRQSRRPTAEGKSDQILLGLPVQFVWEAFAVVL